MTRRPPRAVATAVRYAGAALAGVLVYVASAPRHLWWVAIVAFALLWWALHGSRVRRAALQGVLFGLGFFLPLLEWIQAFLGGDYGPLPWLALSITMALFPAVACALVPLVARLPVAPVWAALLFVAEESGTSRFPSVGFPWGRVAYTQVDGPFLPLAALGGAPLVTFAVVAAGFAVAALLLRRRDGHRGVTRRVGCAAVLAVLVIAAVVAPSPPVAAQNGARTVALVQGNAPNIGVALETQSGLLQTNTLRVSAQLADAVRDGSVPRPDFVVWPETAVQDDGSDPAIDQAVANLGVPVLVGSLDERGPLPTNAVIVWDPRTGAGETYAKQKLVPFGEFMPFRAIAELVTPFVDRADLYPGSAPGLLSVANTQVGVGVCYEVAYDQILREDTALGAQLLVVPTNNAWYGDAEMTYQQQAMARLRAVENGRAVVVAAVSGVSSVIQPDGTVTQETPTYVPAIVSATVPLRTDVTVASAWGGQIELLLLVAAAVGLGAGAVTSTRRRPGAGQPPTSIPPSTGSVTPVT